jgi:hypothetical protein
MNAPHALRAVLSVAPLGEMWHDFFLLSGTAAVTLVGLLFVSLSLHVEILFRPEHRDFREMAGQAFQGYLYVLVSSLVFLVPVATPQWALWTFGFVNVIMLVRALVRIPAYLRARKARGAAGHHAKRFPLPFIAYGLGILSVINGLSEQPGSAIMFLAPILLMLTAATRTAWDLLEYVGRARAATHTRLDPP